MTAINPLNDQIEIFSASLGALARSSPYYILKSVLNGTGNVALNFNPASGQISINAPAPGNMTVTYGLTGGGNMGGAVAVNLDWNALNAVYPSATNTITGGGLAYGGGSLNVPAQIITVPAATTADALAGASTTLVITPATMQAALDQLHTQILGAAPATLSTLAAIDAALGNDPTLAADLTALIALKADKATQINTTYPLQGGSTLNGNVTLTFNQSWSDGIYVPLTRTVTGNGLAVGGGALSANQVITVVPSTNAQAIAGTDNATAVTPASLGAALANNNATINSEIAAEAAARVAGDAAEAAARVAGDAAEAAARVAGDAAEATARNAAIATAVGPYETTAAAAATYQPILTAGANITIVGNTISAAAAAAATVTSASTGLKLVGTDVQPTLGDGTRTVLT
jgi:hypothetical protein